MKNQRLFFIPSLTTPDWVKTTVIYLGSINLFSKLKEEKDERTENFPLRVDLKEILG